MRVGGGGMGLGEQTVSIVKFDFLCRECNVQQIEPAVERLIWIVWSKNLSMIGHETCKSSAEEGLLRHEPKSRIHPLD
jgi:hypothetical protein